ncbi:MAG TPA: clostripain-related cysteine peptidase [Bryobacteraceae bacterium]|jgi:hypothetical protein
MRIISVLGASLCWLTAAWGQAAPVTNSWTVMVYMSGKNNLQCQALVDFAALANVGSVKGAQVFVELGRPMSPSCGKKWSGVRRFHILPGTTPYGGTAVPSRDADMSQGRSVEAFVRWVLAQRTRRTDHYILVMWGHALGLKFQPTLLDALSPSTAEAAPDLSSLEKLTMLPPKIPLGDFRSLGYDETTGNFLHVRDLTDHLAKVGRKLDLIILDSCLMGTLENAYAFKDVTSYLAASETLTVSGTWDYTEVLKVVTNPSDVSSMVSGILGREAGSRAGYDTRTMISAADLSHADEVAAMVSDLGSRLQQQMEKADPASAKRFVDAMLKLRGSLNPFASSSPNAATVDLGALVRKIASSTDVQATTRDVASRIDQRLRPGGLMLPGGYGPPRSAGPGTAIFFPTTLDDFRAIDDGVESYDPGKCDQAHPYKIAFVCEKPGWAAFLNDLLTRASLR